MAAVEDKKKYKTLENVLTRIHKEFISLSDEEVKRNNAILKEDEYGLEVLPSSPLLI